MSDRDGNGPKGQAHPCVIKGACRQAQEYIERPQVGDDILDGGWAFATPREMLHVPADVVV